MVLFCGAPGGRKGRQALILHLGAEGWGHSVTRLFLDLTNLVQVPQGVLLASKRLDKHYIPTRYSSGFDQGISGEYYAESEARQAVQDAKTVYDFCSQSISQLQGGA